MCNQGKCLNTIGSYKCECEAGFVASPDGRFCIGNKKNLQFKKNLHSNNYF